MDYGFESFTFDEVSRRAEVPIGMDADARVEIAAFLVHTVVSLLNYSTMRSEESFDGVVEEIKRMLIAYLFAIATST